MVQISSILVRSMSGTPTLVIQAASPASFLVICTGKHRHINNSHVTSNHIRQLRQSARFLKITACFLGGVYLQDVTKDGRDLGFCLRQASEGLPHVDRQQPGHAGYRVHGWRDTGRRTAAPGTRSLRSTERYLIDRVIHSLVCCSTRVVRRRDALLPKVRSFSSPITVLSQDNLWGGGVEARINKRSSYHIH